MLDDGLLIEQVSCFTFLFNKKDPKYKNKLARENGWKTIAEILGCQNPDVCEQRWITLRAKYTGIKRCVKNTPSGAAAIRSSWPHYDLMGFLDPFLTTRRTTSNYQDPAGSSSSQNAWDSMVDILENSQANGATTVEVVEAESYDSNDVDETFINVNPAPTTPSVKKHCIPRTTMPARKRNTQDAMCESMVNCFETLNKKMKFDETAQETDACDKNEDFHFVRSLVADMNA